MPFGDKPHEPLRRRPRLKRQTVSVALGIGLIVGLLLAGHHFLRGRSSLGPANKTSPPLAITPPPHEIQDKEIEDSFSRNQTITEALMKHGLSGEEIYRVVESARPIYNLAKVGANKPYWLTLTPEGEFLCFRYIVDDDHYLTVYLHDDRYVSVVKEFSFETRVEPVSGTIENSLFETIAGAVEDDKLASNLADIFQWDIDFNTDIQNGDSFRLLVEKKYLDGKFKRYGPILAAEIMNQGKTFSGYRFIGKGGAYEYFAPDGKSLKKSFLKSPLKITRISSNFSRARFHPILKMVHPHLGVDYAAPQGTPVHAVGAGTVVSAGTNGGSGKMVKLRHIGGLETLYLHLSRITVRSGRPVEQGDLIGYVGATGLATGPHLDFRVLRRGRYVDPRKVVLPPSPPVTEPSFTSFAALRDDLQARLQQIP